MWLLGIAGWVWSALVVAQPLKLVASIKPLALMAQAVVADQAQVQVLLKPGQTPHDFAFKVSDRQALADADLVLWVGPTLEPYLSDALGETRQVSMVGAVGFDKPTSEGHSEHGHSSEHDHDGDQHLWLNVDYGAEMMVAIANAMGELDPAHAELYSSNAAREGAKLRALSTKVNHALNVAESLAATRSYGAVHGAYEHFLASFHYPAPLVLSDSPEIGPGAKRLWTLSQQLQSNDCLMVESLNTRRWVNSFAQRQSLAIVQADIMGREAATYYELLDKLTRVFEGCLKEN